MASSPLTSLLLRHPDPAFTLSKLFIFIYLFIPSFVHLRLFNISFYSPCLTFCYFVSFTTYFTFSFVSFLILFELLVKKTTHESIKHSFSLSHLFSLILPKYFEESWWVLEKERNGAPLWERKRDQFNLGFKA